MSMIYLRLTIIGEQKELVNVSSYFSDKVEEKDVSATFKAKQKENVGFNAIYNNYVFVKDFFLSKDTKTDKYEELIKVWFTNVDKKHISKVNFIQVDNCTHDEEKIAPCTKRIIIDWSN